MELMIAVVIAAILAAIAIPGYRGYVQRAQRTEAKSVLLRIQAAQEKFFVQNNRYATALAPAVPGGLGIPATTETGLYALTIVRIDGGNGFRVTATPRPGGAQDDDARCASFTVDQNGLKGARNAAGEDSSAECWR